MERGWAGRAPGDKTQCNDGDRPDIGTSVQVFETTLKVALLRVRSADQQPWHGMGAG